MATERIQELQNNPAHDSALRLEARRRAEFLEEAGYFGRCFQVLLRRASYKKSRLQGLKRLIGEANPSEVLDWILKDVRDQELTERQKSQGRIEGRGRLKARSGAPLTENRPVRHVFLDESGSSAFSTKETTPVFVLGAVSMTEKSVSDYVKECDALKQYFFGTSEITFHEPHMRRRNGPFGFGGDKDKAEAFDRSWAELLDKTQFTAFAVGIRKNRFDDLFRQAGVEPFDRSDLYVIAIMLMTERVVHHLAYEADRPMGRLTFESITPNKDAFHQLEFSRIMLEGTRYMSDADFQYWLQPGCTFMPKAQSHPLEISDLVSRETFEFVVGGCTRSPKFWEILCPKLYCHGDGMRGKFGLKVFPHVDILEDVMAHRESCRSLKN
jgi:hypothetical protein